MAGPWTKTDDAHTKPISKRSLTESIRGSVTLIERRCHDGTLPSKAERFADDEVQRFCEMNPATHKKLQQSMRPMTSGMTRLVARYQIAAGRAG